MVRVVLVGSLSMDLVMIHPIIHRLEVCDWEGVVSTAAGDCFMGALATSYAEGMTLLKAARIANGAAARPVTRRGAQPPLPYRVDVEEFICGKDAPL